MKRENHLKGTLLVVIGALLWGVCGTFAQFLFNEYNFSPKWLVSIRLLISGILLLLFSLIKKDSDLFNIWHNKTHAFKLIIFSILGMLGVQYTYFNSINASNAATATILQYLSPVIIVIYIIIKTKKLPILKESIAILLALIGTFFIITKGNINSLYLSNSALFWGISSAITSAFYTLSPVPLLKTYSSTVVIGYGMFIGGFILSLFENPFNCTGIWTSSSLLSVIFVIIFGTLIAFTFYLSSLKYIHPTEASILGCMEPLSAAFLSVFWLKVNFTLADFIGTFFILTTVIILSYSKK